MNNQILLAPQPTIKRIADLEGADFYPTPIWATKALLENEPFNGDIWECACGDGSMSEVLKEYNNEVFSSDLYDRGYGEPGIDFTQEKRQISNIITNPPFHSAEEFVEAGLRNATSKVALLLRLAFLEGIKRQKNIFATTPPTTVWVFSERITFYPKGAVRNGSGTTAYAWFVWDKKNTGTTNLKWLPLGQKTRYSEPS